MPLRRRWHSAAGINSSTTRLVYSTCSPGNVVEIADMAPQPLYGLPEEYWLGSNSASNLSSRMKKLGPLSTWRRCHWWWELGMQTGQRGDRQGAVTGIMLLIMNSMYIRLNCISIWVLHVLLLDPKVYCNTSAVAASMGVADVLGLCLSGSMALLLDALTQLLFLYMPSVSIAI